MSYRVKEHRWCGMKPGPDKLPGVPPIIMCSFCDKRFETLTAAAAHEKMYHHKRLRTLSSQDYKPTNISNAMNGIGYIFDLAARKWRRE